MKSDNVTDLVVVRTENVAMQIRNLHYGVVNHCMKALGKAMMIGELLNKQKESLNHGEWLPWVSKYLDFDERTARRYMLLAKPESRERLQAENVQDLKTAYKLLAGPVKPKAKPKPNTVEAFWQDVHKKLSTIRKTIEEHPEYPLQETDEVTLSRVSAQIGWLSRYGREATDKAEKEVHQDEGL